MTDTLVDLPTMDQLLADPAKAATLPPEVARTLLCGLAGVLPVLIAQSSQHAGQGNSPSTPERFLTVDQAALQFGVSDKWLYRHKRQLPHSQPSRKVLLFPEEKLRRWFAARKTG